MWFRTLDVYYFRYYRFWYIIKQQPSPSQPSGHRCWCFHKYYVSSSVLWNITKIQGRSWRSAGCSDKVKIWIMLITPRISAPLWICPMSPTDRFSIEASLTETHLMTLWRYSLTGGGVCQQDGAGCHWSHTHRSLSPVWSQRSSVQGCSGSQSAGCRRGNPRGPSERITTSLHLL